MGLPMLAYRRCSRTYSGTLLTSRLCAIRAKYPHVKGGLHDLYHQKRYGLCRMRNFWHDLLSIPTSFVCQIQQLAITRKEEP